MLEPTDLVLVAFLPTPRDLEIARLLGWYRIPLRTAPKVVAVDYLAFYQPASFGERGGQIEYIAEVRGHELTTRGELLKDEAERDIDSVVAAVKRCFDSADYIEGRTAFMEKRKPVFTGR